jgi:hypothetical protein
MTPGNGVTFQWRDNEDGPTSYVTKPGVGMPQWVKLERTGSGNFIAKHSANGTSWQDVNAPDASPVSPLVPMGTAGDPNLYIGTAVTSHDALETCTADLNDVRTVPALSPPWAYGDIGNNDAEQLYVALSDGSVTAVVEHDDVNAATVTDWQEWNIALSEFSDQGLNLSNVRKVYVGLGDRSSPVQGGSGALYIDDIRACPPRCVPSIVKPEADIAVPYDCVVDEKDIRVLAGDWLLSDELIVTSAPSSIDLVAHWPLDADFYDYSGNGFHGDPNADADLISDVNRGQVLTLDGSGDFVDCGNPTDPCALDFSTGNWTVCAWIKTTMSGTGDQNKGVIYAKGGDRGGGHRYGLYVNEEQGIQGRLTLVTDDDVNKRVVNSSILINDGRWHHVAGLRDVNDLRVYVDGLPDGTNSNVPTGYDLSGTHQHNAYIGAITNHAADSNGTVIYKFLEGSVDDVRIYDYALLPEEVAYLAVDGEPGLHVPIPSVADFYKGEVPGEQWINLKDYSLIASKYLEEKLWPFEQ